MYLSPWTTYIEKKSPITWCLLTGKQRHNIVPYYSFRVLCNNNRNHKNNTKLYYLLSMQFLGRCLNTECLTLGFNISLGTRRTLMHEKKNMFDPYFIILANPNTFRRAGRGVYYRCQTENRGYPRQRRFESANKQRWDPSRLFFYRKRGRNCTG